MKHFKTVKWRDSVNRVAPDDPRKDLQKHRGTGRKCCVQTRALWQKVLYAAAVEASYQPPAERVRVLKAGFAAAGLAAKRQGTSGLVQLLYDSFSQPALAGTRSAASGIRHMLYRAEPYQIDIQIELHQEQDRFVITGQLADLSHPEMVGRDVQVMLSDGREYILNTVTNHFGEFRGEAD